MYCAWEKHEICTSYSLCHYSKHWIPFIWCFVKYMVICYDIWKCASRCFTCRNCNCFFLYLTNKNRFYLWMFVLAEDVVTHGISLTAWINRRPPCISVSWRTLVSNVRMLVLCTFILDIWMCEQKTPKPGKHGNITRWIFNPLNPELNPIRYLLELLAHHFLHVSRIRVKSLTIRLLMSYIYGAPILDVSRSHTTTHHSR